MRDPRKKECSEGEVPRYKLAMEYICLVNIQYPAIMLDLRTQLSPNTQPGQAVYGRTLHTGLSNSERHAFLMAGKTGAFKDRGFFFLSGIPPLLSLGNSQDEELYPCVYT